MLKAQDHSLTQISHLSASCSATDYNRCVKALTTGGDAYEVRKAVANFASALASIGPMAWAARAMSM